HLPIVPELKFSSEGLWATLESENAWSTCGSLFQYRTYYDDVTLERVQALPVPAAGGAWPLAIAAALFGAGVVLISIATKQFRRTSALLAIAALAMCLQACSTRSERPSAVKAERSPVAIPVGPNAQASMTTLPTLNLALSVDAAYAAIPHRRT